ncbi:MAG: hypothetical protein M1827_005501 [Pycnora praestabilis]|nr:MAG: hypothetical protein M1827_005501 [Pycnora praestabilis]
MAPSPAAGKADTGDMPKTPTKPGKNPKSNTTSKLGKSTSVDDTPAKDVPKPSTPKSAAPKLGKPKATKDATKAADSPSLPPRPKETENATEAAEDTTEKAKDAAPEAPADAESEVEEAGEKLEMKDNDPEQEDNEDTPQAKVSQAGNDTGAEESSAVSTADDAEDELDEAAPEPVDDEEEDAGEATETAEDAADDTQETTEGAVGGATDTAKGAAGDKVEKEGEEGEEEEPVEDAKQKGQGALNGAKGLAGKASGAKDAAGDAAEDAKGATEDAKGTVEDAGEEATGKTKDAGEDVTSKVEETAGDATEGGDVDGVKETAEEGANGVKESAKEGADDVKGTVEEGADGVKETAEDAAEELPVNPEDYVSALDGLKIGEDGQILGEDGEPVGKVTEGDPEDLAGQTVNENGEVLDEDGDVIGRCEVSPEKAAQLAQAAKGKAEDTAEDAADQLDVDPSDYLSIMKGLELSEDGQILDKEGEPVGKLTEGDPEVLAGQTLNENGEILDEDGDVVGRAEVLPEKAQALAQAAKDAEEAEKAALENLPAVNVMKGLEANEEGEVLGEDGTPIGKVTEGNPEDLVGKSLNEKGEFVNEDGEVIGKAEVVPGEAADKLNEAALEDLPSVDVLKGLETNEDGEIIGEDGEVIGKVTEGNTEDLAGQTLNEKGEFVNEEGEVIGKAEVVPGAAAEKLKEAAQSSFNALSILEGRKVNKKGNVLDEEGEIIGKLSEGDAKKCAGMTINENGEVLDKKGNVIGKMEIVPGEASEGLIAEAKEAAEEAAEDLPKEEVSALPDLSILEGMKVNKKGEVLNEDGEPIARLSEGELSDVAGKKLNDKGEILDKDGKVIGKVELLEAAKEEVEGEEGEEGEGAEEAAEETEPEFPPLSILEGLRCNKQGKIVTAEGKPVGELIEGDAKKLAKSGAECDDEGQFWDGKGKVIGRAKTLPQEDEGEEAPFAGLEGLIVIEGGKVKDENDNIVGELVEGDAKKLVGRSVDEDGDVIDKHGNTIGHAERLEEIEEPEEEKPDLSILNGKAVNKQGNVIGDEGVPIARLVEGDAKQLAGKKCDGEGQIWNDAGKVVGRCELIPENERESKPEGIFGGLEGLVVVKDGKVADEEGNIVGEVVEGDPKKLVGRAVDEDGDIIDKYGNIKGHAEPIEEQEETPDDLSILAGKVLNKQGNVIGDEGVPIARLVEGEAKKLAGKKLDGEGQIWGDNGKVIGRCELIPEAEREDKPEGPFAGLEGLIVVKGGMVEDEGGNTVGQVVEGDPKKLVGRAVDDEGDIVDKYGNVKGHAEPYEEPDVEEVDLSILDGKTVNKAGMVVDGSGQVFGKLIEGDPKELAGRKVDGQGQVWGDAGKVVGHAGLLEAGEGGKPEGPFAGWENLVVGKEGHVMSGENIVGRLIEGDPKKLEGRIVDEDGEVLDKNGNSIGKAERWEPEEKERHINPMSGRKVNKNGEVFDENGNLLGKLTEGNLKNLIGFEVDDNGFVIDNDGNKVGECTLIENLEEDEGPTEEELEAQRKAEEDDKLADAMANQIQNCLDRIQPVCKMIKEHMEKADRTPKEELDEEQLVNDVKPLIEEGGRILQECNGAIRGLDPDGRIANQAKGKAAQREATPSEYRLADLLKELTTTVTTTIDDAKKKLNDMPHAKKKLNPLWGLLTQPLFQILAAVGLLLAGVLGLVGQLLNGLGLGGLVNGLFGGLGIDKILGGLGLGSITESLGLGGGKKKK